MAAAAPSVTTEGVESLRAGDLDRTVKEAVRRWSATGLTTSEGSRLDRLTARTADLPGLMLGRARGTAIDLDTTAAGHGWFVDATIRDGESFAGIDLLTVVMHEIGHVLGREHAAPETGAGALMSRTLEAGTRHLRDAGDDSPASTLPDTADHRRANASAKATADAVDTSARAARRFERTADGLHDAWLEIPSVDALHEAISDAMNRIVDRIATLRLEYADEARTLVSGVLSVTPITQDAPRSSTATAAFDGETPHRTPIADTSAATAPPPLTATTSDAAVADDQEDARAGRSQPRSTTKAPALTMDHFDLTADARDNLHWAHVNTGAWGR